MKVTVTNGVGVFAETFKGKLPVILKNGVMRCAQVAAGEIRRVVYTVFKGRTGQLARSYRETFLGTAQGGVVSAGALSPARQAAILDEGGTVRARTVTKIAIPLPSANVPYGKWPRDYARGELHPMVSRRGNTLLADRSGKPLFVLKPQVTIRGRSYLANAATSAEPKMADVMGGEITISVGRR